jgi:hypothetical protein
MGQTVSFASGSWIVRQTPRPHEPSEIRPVPAPIAACLGAPCQANGVSIDMQKLHQLAWQFATG